MANSCRSDRIDAGIFIICHCDRSFIRKIFKTQSFSAFQQAGTDQSIPRGKALMFRFATYKDHHTLTNLDIKVNAALLVEENGKWFLNFMIWIWKETIRILPMNWTVVHPLNLDSPLFEYTAEDMKKADLEIYVSVRGFDDVYSNVVQQRTSYTYDEILFGRKFVQMYRESNDGKPPLWNCNDYMSTGRQCESVKVWKYGSVEV